MRFRTLLLITAMFVLPVAAEASFFSEDAPPAPITATGVTFETAFSPTTTLSPLVVKAILSAKKSVRVSARLFTSKPVSEAIVKATRAGVDVKVVLSRKTNMSTYSAAQFLVTMSMPPHLTKSEDGLFSDYIVIDDHDIIVGNVAGFIDTDEEKTNNASVLVIHNAPELAKQYLADWQMLWNASEEMKKEKD